MNQSIAEAAETCRDSPINAYWNNVTGIPDQSVIDAASLSPFLAYIIVGAIASAFNIICIHIFVTKKELRQKYLLFAFLAFANLFNTLFMLISGYRRRLFIFTNQYNQLRSSFVCLQYPGPHLQIIGNQLPALVLLVIDIERLIAVYRPMFYKVNITDRNRIFIVIGCSVTAVISLLFGYFSSYLNRATCVSGSCAVANTFGLPYSNYNSTIVIVFPVVAFILNIFAYIGAKRLGKNAYMRKELKLILITLIITSVDVLLIAGPNIILVLVYNGVVKTGSWFRYLYVCFCCNSAINLFVYICLKRDFRNHLLESVSFGGLKKFLNLASEITNTRPTRRIVPSNGSNVPIHRSARTMRIIMD